MIAFNGMRILVTGGASGIGAAVAALLTEAGADVAVLDLRAAANSRSYLVDLSDADSVAQAVEGAARDLGGLDAVINNAGIGATGDVTANSDDEWHRVFDVNVLGAVRVSRCALPYLRRSASASITNTSSVVAVTGVPQRVLYSATKGALAAMTLAMAADHAAEGIRVNAVLPGTANTPWIQNLMKQTNDPAGTRTALEQRQPIGRLVEAAEVAAAIAYLASPAAASTTGTLLTVDGGMSSLRIPATK